MRLFSDGLLSDYLGAKLQDLNQEVSKMKDQEISTCDIDSWSEYLESKYRI